MKILKNFELENENFNTILLREVQPPTVPIRSFPPRPEPDFPSEIVKEPALRLRENPLVEFSWRVRVPLRSKKITHFLFFYENEFFITLLNVFERVFLQILNQSQLELAL